MSRKIKILIVEDDYRLATEWQTELKTAGYAADTVLNSTEALVALPNNYDYFIVDLFHVENNKFHADGGIKCISEIRKHNKANAIKAKIIAVTGYYRKASSSVVSTSQVVKNLGAEYALSKPLDIQKIIDIIRKG